ncbi:MAG: WD40 repeat domain-containing protein, partial [Pirellulaceae bacterium]
PGFEAAIEFLNESKEAATAEERERELRRQRELEQAQRLAEAQLKARRRSQGLTVCAMVAAIVIGFFWNSASDARREAEKARGQAEKQRDVAESAAEKERLAKEAEAIQRGIAERESQQNRLGLYAASIRQAERELSSGVSRNAGLDQLDQWKQVTSVDGNPDTPAVRDWEWYYLRGKAKSLDLDPRIETLKLGSRVNNVGRWSPDGEKLAVTGSGRQILVIDGQTREIIQMFQRRRSKPCPRIAWGPDGESIAIDNWFGPVEIYDLNTGMLTQMLNHNGGELYTISWNHTHNLIAYCLDQGKVGIYDMAQKQLVSVFSTSSRVRAIEWSPDGSQLAFSVTPGGLHILDYPSMKVSYKLGSQNVQHLRWTPDGKQLICRDVRPDQLFVVTPATNSLTPPVESGIGSVWGMAVHPQKPWVALSGPRGEIGIFDYRKQALVESLKGFPGMVFGVDWRPQGDLLFISGFTFGETMLVDLSKQRKPLIETGLTLSRNQTKLLPDGKRVALSSDVTGRLLVADFGKNEVISTIDTPLNDLIYSHDWSPNGKLLAVAGIQTLLILDGQNPDKVQASYSLEDIGRLESLEWSNCGRYLAFTRESNAKSNWGVFEYEGPSLNLLQLDDVDSPPCAIAWHPNQPKLAVGLRQKSRSGGPIQLWDVSTQNLELTIASVDTNVCGLSFSHRGDRLAVIFDRPLLDTEFEFESSGAIEIFSNVDGSSLVKFPPQSVDLTDVNWRTTDQRLVTASFDGNVRVWRADGTELLTLNPFNSAPVRSAFWDKNGGRLIACAPNNTELYSWSIEDGLDGVTLNGSPVLLENLLSKGGIDPLKSANLYTSSGQYDRAAKIFDQLSEGSPTVNIFSSHYWRLREYPDPLSQIANSDLSVLDPAKLKSILDAILTNSEEQSDSPSTSWDYMGRDTSRLNLMDSPRDEFSRLQIIRTRYYATRSAQVALVLGGGENIIAWHNNELAIDHRLPGLQRNGEIGASLNLDQGWNDIIFAVYSDSQQLELKPHLLETPSRILANSLVTWDGLSSGAFERAASELNLSPLVKTTIRYYLEILFGDFDAATSTLEGMTGANRSKFFDHALLLGERGEFEKAAKYAQQLYDDFPAPYTEALLGETLAKSNGISLVNSEAEWDCYVPSSREGDQDIGNLLKESTADRDNLWHQKLGPGSLRYWVGNSGFTRTLPNRGVKEAILFQTSFDTELPLENLLFELDTPVGFVVYLDGEECYRVNVSGPDRFNKRSAGESFDNFARHSIPLSKSLTPGRHRLAVSVHQELELNNLKLRCPTLTGFTDGLPEIREGVSPGVELAFHLSVAATRGHFDHARVNALLDSGIDRLRIEDISQTIYAILESSKTLDDSERLALGKILSKATLPARSSNISLAIAPTLRLGDDEKMEELLAKWNRLTADDSRLLAAELLSKHRLEADGYEKTRTDYLTTANRNRLNSHQQLLICALALTPLSEEQHQILEDWKSELSFWQDQSEDNALNGLSSALLALQSNTIDETTKDWLSRLEKAEIQSPVDRYLASAILDRALDSTAQESSLDRQELQSKLDATLQMDMHEHEEVPFTLEQWIKYRVAKSLLN